MTDHPPAVRQNQLQVADEVQSLHEDGEIYHKWTTFKINEELFGIDVIQVKEVLRYSEITPVPGSGSFILGIINLRGNVVTVLDTRQMFGLGVAENNDDTRIIVVDFDEQEVVGLVVDSVNEVVNLPNQSIERSPKLNGEDGSRQYVQGVSYYQNVLLILLDLTKMLRSVTPEDYYDENNNS